MVRKELFNGLRVVVLQLPHVHSVSEALYVRSGPRYETESQNGISHLVEHLLFQGTVPHPSSLDFHVAVETLGGEINGLTQRDATTMHLTVPPRHASEGLQLLGEVCTQPLLSRIEIERDVVMEEILDTLDGDGAQLDIDSISRSIFWEGHPMSMPVAGELANVESFTEAECRAHFERTFVASNAALCIAGPVDPEEMIRAAERWFGGMPRGGRPPERFPPIPARSLPIHIQPTDDSQVSVTLSYPAPHENHPEFASLLLMKRILDDGFASRLRQSVCEQRGLAYSLSASIDAYGDVAAFDLDLACAPKKLCAAVEQMLVTVEGVASDLVDKAELDRAKTRHVADLEFALDDPSEICGWFGTSELVNSKTSYEQRLDQVMAVTPYDLQHLAQRIFASAGALLTIVGPVEDADLPRLEKLMNREPDSTLFLDIEDEDQLEACA